jgi:hypothetical protein
MWLVIWDSQCPPELFENSYKFHLRAKNYEKIKIFHDWYSKYSLGSATVMGAYNLATRRYERRPGLALPLVSA